MSLILPNRDKIVKEIEVWLSGSLEEIDSGESHCSGESRRIRSAKFNSTVGEGSTLFGAAFLAYISISRWFFE